MTESHPRTKLKRKKSSVEELQSEACVRQTPRSGPTALFPGSSAAKPAGSAVPAASWWNTQPLPAVDGLWASTLTSALPYLENQHWDPVSDLPRPSAVRALRVDEVLWCDLNSQVPAFPEPSAPSPGVPSSPRSLGSSQQDPSAQTKPAPHPPDQQLFSSSRQSPDNRAASPQHVSNRQQSSLHRQDEATPSAGPSRDGGGEGTTGGEPEEEPGPVSRQLVSVSDSRAPLQEEGGNTEEVTEGEEGEAVQRSGGVGVLQSCPMCLQLFPDGFTQMDCDGHLAQCLSELNVDMTW
ncbi:uncharacterized protein si:ch73-70k4.1 [Stegastes partitus]|uniref:Uncharacterized protein si:ch73-70k4.1 n=1 Tax=Stegastes partitus TaxID=144197 RepID=A0A9Y4JRR4_9TELE|nr:PREDICTED: Fanconi anemia-associated protein of 20 kDa [Stegastes partitus]